MTPPDAVVNAPVEERHRREAVDVYYQPEHGAAPRYVHRWVEQGHWGPISNAFLTRTAQAIADAAPQWQPIATAPRKSTREQPHILLTTEGEPAAAFAGNWCEWNGCWVDHRGRSGPEDYESYRPTHWMPIPPVPARAALEGKP